MQLPGSVNANPIRSRRTSGIVERRKAAERPSLDVLVVDDDADARELVAEGVVRFGHQCRVAVDGLDALRLLDEHPADVVVSDWDMPGMTGAELCARIRSLGDEAPYTYFIMMTAFDDRQHLLEGMGVGADDYQRKPVSFDELEARLVSAGRVVDLHRRLAARTAELEVDSERLYQSSRTDALTGVGNRMRLDEELALLFTRALRYGHKCALGICDVDHFKAYNDRFGHVAGDEALRAVANALRTRVRSDDVVFRYGGEEFVVVLIEQTLQEAEGAMERLRLAVESLGISAAHDGVVTVSVGVAELDVTRDENAVAWVARADEALYEAKARGRNRVISTRPPGSGANGTAVWWAKQ